MRTLLFALVVAAVSALQFLHMENAIQRDDWEIQLDSAGRSDILQTEHEVVFAIQQKNMDKLEQILSEVSDPQNPRYGK